MQDAQHSDDTPVHVLPSSARISAEEIAAGQLPAHAQAPLAHESGFPLTKFTEWSKRTPGQERITIDFVREHYALYKAGVPGLSVSAHLPGYQKLRERIVTSSDQLLDKAFIYDRNDKRAR